MSGKLPTIKEIAKQLSISVSTVSRALNDHPSIGIKTRTAVKQKARELNYHPNQTAISFKRNQTSTIGVIVPDLKEEFFVSILNGIEEIVRQHKYIALITQSHDSMQREIELVDTMKKYRVDGLLVSLAKDNCSLQHFDELAAFDIPVVYFDRIPHEQPVHYIRCCIYESTIKMIETLYEKNHQQIGLILGPENFPDKNERWAGYKDGLQKLKIPYRKNLVKHTDLSYPSTLTAMRELLSLKNPPTVIITLNDYVALDAMKAIKELSPPQPIPAFASYANISVFQYLENEPLISIEQYPFTQGRKAATLLLELINDKEKKYKALPPQQITLQSKLVIR